MISRFRWVAAAMPLVMMSTPAHAQTMAGSSPVAMRADYGITLAVGDDEVMIGEPSNRVRPGIVYVYRKSGGTWSEAAQLTAPNAQWSDGFGAALALDGQRLLVSIVGDEEPGVVHVFEEQAGQWQHTGEFTAGPGGDAFGAALALAGDIALVGAPATSSGAGAVYVFERSASGTWTQQARLVAPDETGPSVFGAAVAFLGNAAVIGAPGAANAAGLVFLFSPVSGAWNPNGAFAPNGLAPATLFGASIAASGNRLYVGAPAYGNFAGAGRGGRGGGGGAGVGAVFGFEYVQMGGEEGIAEIGRYLPFAADGGDAFGASIAVSDGELWFGAPGGGGGSAFLYSVGADESIGVRRLQPVMDGGGSRGGPEFGAAVAVRGAVAAVGMPGADGSGKVQIYERQGANWVAANELQGAPDALPAVNGSEIRCDGGKAEHFDCSSVDLVSFMPTLEIGGTRTSRINDVWGWTDSQSGREYVIVGRSDGAGFVDISDPENPRYLGSLPRTEGTQTSTWRDMKVYDDHVFIVADGATGHGMQVFDLTRLRDVTGAPVEFTEDAHYDGVSAVHNIVINQESGFAYAVGSRSGGETCGGGLHMIDIRDPKNPTFAGCFADPETGRRGTGYSHDAQCVTYHGPDQDYDGHEICIGANETALSVADVTDKANPVAVARASYPGVGYAHQGWFTEDHRYFYLDDELDEINADDEGTPLEGTRTMIWDLSDLDDPRLAGIHYGDTGASDHNLYIVGTTMYQSNYQAGLRVLDISDPENPIEFGYLDTVPYGTNTAGFGGSWSNYPFFESGVVAVTSGSEGLLLVRVRKPRVISN